jgi:DNA-binding transcriptional regulator YhcF (GntR family)
MDIEHLYLWMLSKRALSDVALRVLLYIQIAHKVMGNPEKRIVFISRRRICKKIGISIGACRSAVKQLVDLGFIKMCDPKGNPVEDLTSNWMTLQRKENLNQNSIKSIIEQLDKPSGLSDGGSVDDPESGGLFDNLFRK